MADTQKALASRHQIKPAPATSKTGAAKGAAAAAAAEDEEGDPGLEVLTADQRRMLELVTEELQQSAACDKRLDELAGRLVEAQRRLAWLELRCPTAIVWRIGDVSSRLKAARTGQAAAFEGGSKQLSRLGYRLALTVCLYGEGRARGKSFSIFVAICKGEFDHHLTWPFRLRIYLSILNQGGGRDLTRLLMPNTCPENRAFLGRPVAERNAKFGIEDFAPIEQLLASNSMFVKDDALYVRLEVPIEDFETGIL